MEIEIVTTKKKLTKSILDQMPWLSITNYVGLTTCKCLGHFKIKGTNIGLVQYNDTFYKLDLAWLQGKDNYMLHRCKAKREFSSEKTKNKHFDAYEVCKNKSLLTQIYY